MSNISKKFFILGNCFSLQLHISPRPLFRIGFPRSVALAKVHNFCLPSGSRTHHKPSRQREEPLLCILALTGDTPLFYAHLHLNCPGGVQTVCHARKVSFFLGNHFLHLFFPWHRQGNTCKLAAFISRVCCVRCESDSVP